MPVPITERQQLGSPEGQALGMSRPGPAGLSFLSRNLERLERFLGLHVLEVLYRDLETPPLVPLPSQYAVRLMDREEALALSRDPAFDITERMVDTAYSTGGGCVGAFDGREVAGCSWFAFRDTPYDRRGAMVRVPGDSMYRYKAFVRPIHRGAHLSAKLFHEGGRLARHAGRRHSFALVALYNERSLKASRAAGRQRLGRVVMLNKGPFFLAWHSRAVRDFGIALYRGPRG